MATAKPIKGKNGTSYKITVSCGYDKSGKQLRQFMTWTPELGMSEKKIEKELERQKVLFEEKVKDGMVSNSTIRFKDFAEMFFTDYAGANLKRKTVHGYKQRMPRVYKAIGHIKLKDLRSNHLNSFYRNLGEEGMNQHTKGKLSPSTIHSYHRTISSILSKAVKWGYIPFNPADNADLPRMERKEAACLDEEEVRRFLSLLHKYPIKYRAALTFDILSGLRRGELLGLRWCDVNYEYQTISIVQTLNYVPKEPLYIDTPKNHQPRTLKLSPTAFVLLNELRVWQNKQKLLCGDRWKNKHGLIFTSEDGGMIHPDTVSSWMREFCDLHGFPKEVHLHSLRHSYASLMIADGTPLVTVSKRMGHREVSTTANIYAHQIASTDERAAQVAEKFADVVQNQEEKKGTTA